MNLLSGLQVRQDRLAQVRVWVVDGKAMDFHSEEARSARLEGKGHEGYRPAAYQIGNVLVCHPDIYKALIEKTQEAPDGGPIGRTSGDQ